MRIRHIVIVRIVMLFVVVISSKYIISCIHVLITSQLLILRYTH